MGLFDFLFGRKNEPAKETIKTEPSVPSSKEALRSNPSQATSVTLTPFVFHSTSHQRYQSGQPVMGLQLCGRTVRVDKNTNGCPGYRLSPGDGYIIRVFNDDLGKPNMSDKPMRIVNATKDKIELRGFPIEAQTPFGWQEVDYSDYGFSIYYKNGSIEKCVLHMFDRSVDLEYRQEKVSSSNGPVKSKPETHTTLTKTETFVKEALTNLSVGRQDDSVYHPLYKAWKELVNNPSQLKEIKNYSQVGMGMLIFLSFGTVQDIDDRQQIASLAYFLLSKAIQQNPQDINNYKNRILDMLEHSEAFGYTVSSVVNQGGDGFGFLGALDSFEARDSLFKMQYADLSMSPALLGIPQFAAKKSDLDAKIANGFFGSGCSPQSIVSEGKKLHNDVLDYLERKLIDEEDFEF